MENKTDKPYSLQDAKESISKINGFNDWSYLRSKYSKDGIETTMAEAAELYASKATEELRRELKAVRDCMNDSNRINEKEIEELRKENEELQTQVSMFQTDRSERIEEMKRLKESNKELLEALKNTTTRMTRARKILTERDGVEDSWQMLNASKYESLIHKSEGDVNKKV